MFKQGRFVMHLLKEKNPKVEIHFYQIDINSVMVSFFGPLKNPN